ncbi:MAG: outer membrane beta-barrel protein [Gammaproteobacteria bacterium]|nr:outer membrane beta-barrel protein [Gammaproteobacteria bacterium]
MAKVKQIMVLGILVFSTGAVNAHCMQNKYYMGAGMGLNSSQDYSDTAGYQLFAGYCLDFNFKSLRSKTSVEVGYMDTGDFEKEQNAFGNNPNRTGTVNVTKSYSSLWLAGLAEYKFDNKMHIMGRAGLDVGDQTGLLFGGGAGYNVTKYAQIRAEYIIHDEVDSFQLNWVSEF